jgi:hypothetical protein
LKSVQRSDRRTRGVGAARASTPIVADASIGDDAVLHPP